MEQINDSNQVESSPEYWLEEPYIVYVGFNESEVNNASWLVFREETGGKQVFGAYCVTFTLSVFGGLGILGIFTKTPPAEEYLTWILLISILDVILIPPLVSIWLWQVLKQDRLKTFARESRFGKPNIFSISKEGVQVQIGSDTTIAAWSHITACYELAESITLVIDGAMFPLPKRCFHNNEQLKRVRRLIIKMAVPYNTVGPQKTTTTFAGVAATNILSLDSASILQNSECESKSSEPNLAYTEKHPNSSLITEPLLWQPASQSLTVECNYSLEELKTTDKKVFIKFEVPIIGVQYIIYFFALLAYTQFTLLIYGPIKGDEINSILLKCSPLLIVGALAHARYLFEKRIEQLRETVKDDLPIFITMTTNECNVRSRRTVLTLAWEQFSNCISTKEHYICRIGKASVIIPKRCLDSRSKEIYVENLLSSKIKKYEEWS